MNPSKRSVKSGIIAKICAALGIDRTEGGRLNVPKILAVIRESALLADELARVRAECGVRQIQGYVDGRTDRAELLQRWLDFHTAEAGMTAAIVCDRARFDEFMTQVHSREQELIADTKAALSISKRGRT